MKEKREVLRVSKELLREFLVLLAVRNTRELTEKEETRFTQIVDQAE